MTAWDPWEYQPDSRTDATDLDVVGYHVEATDGSIGTVDEVGTGYLVVDTGPWILGRRVMLPAGTVTRIDQRAGKIYIGRTKDQIKASPPLDASYTEPLYRDELGGYYGGFYGR
jgi:hypothetical protein